MMLIKLFLFFLLLLILPDMYIYKAYIRRVYQKWTHWAYWLPSLFLLLGMILVFSIHEPRPDSMQRLSNFLLIFLCFSVPKALFVIVILFMKLLYIISGKKLYGGYVAGGLALASLIYVIYGATEGKQHFQIREVTISSDELPSGFSHVVGFPGVPEAGGGRSRRRGSGAGKGRKRIKYPKARAVCE